MSTTPDQRTMFVGIQHPGEDCQATFAENSNWQGNSYNSWTKA